MKKFFLKIGFAILCFSSLIVGVYFFFFVLLKNVVDYDNDCVFVWGDSQMYRGLDVSLLNNRLNKQVLSSAGNGEGIYDFLVSGKNIPNNSTCIVSFPECALLRDPTLDYDRIGFELSCIQILFQAGCPINDCLRIINWNRGNISYKTFDRSHILFPYSDRIGYPEPLSGFCHMFSEEKDYFSWKARAYHKGIHHLLEKQVQVILVHFPLEKQVEDCAQNSTNRHLTDSLKQVIIENYAFEYNTITLSSDSLLMYDLSHMNEVGARLLTTEIAGILQNDTVNNHFIEVSIR
jgi:hypothetical protein